MLLLGSLPGAIRLRLRAASLFIPLIVLTLIFTAASAALAQHQADMSRESELLYMTCWRLVVAGWVYLDRQTSHLSLPFEFDAFVFFLWPVALPYYLYKSRGGRGLLLMAFVFALLVIPSFVEVILRIIYRG